jgi:hypothetical protein
MAASVRGCPLEVATIDPKAVPTGWPIASIRRRERRFMTHTSAHRFELAEPGRVRAAPQRRR